MIQLSRNYSLPEAQDDLIPIKVIGVGGAGLNAIDRIILDGLERADLVVANTDAQSLTSSVATQKVQLGRMTTHGLGAGGDPELGHNAALEASSEIREAISDGRMIFICAGLGGGTGSGAAPVIAELARENGAMVISFVTLPFSFEGKRRMKQAAQALDRLGEISDAVICFENDRMGDIVAPKAGVHQAFAAADLTISQSVRAIVNILQRPGMIRIGFDDLLSALRNRNARCVFGYGESDSDNRAHDALTQALKSPLMDRGRLLQDAVNVLVHVAGGPGMTFSEVEILMQEVKRHIGDETQILFGTAVDNRMGNRMTVTLISSLAADGEQVQPPLWTAPKAVTKPAPASATPELDEPEPEEAAPVEAFAPEPELQAIEAKLPEPEPEPELTPEPELQPDLIENAAPEPELVAPEPASSSVPEPPLEIIAPEPPPRVILPAKKKAVVVKDPPKPVEKIIAKQEVLQFESVTRGRFEKSEPTIVEGQDLDVPTFLRKNVRVK